VRTPFSQHVARFVSRADRASYHREAANEALAPARELLNRHGVPFSERVELGDKAQAITRVAKHIGAVQIVMGTARKNSLTRLIEDSVTNRVLELTDTPVEIVAGEAVSTIEAAASPGAAGFASIDAGRSASGSARTASTSWVRRRFFSPPRPVTRA